MSLTARVGNSGEHCGSVITELKELFIRSLFNRRGHKEDTKKTQRLLCDSLRLTQRSLRLNKLTGFLNLFEEVMTLLS